MRRRDIDQRLAHMGTYRAASLLCKHTFALHLKGRSKAQPSIEADWLWFWRGWYKQLA